MKRQLTQRVPPIAEVWREVSCFGRDTYWLNQWPQHRDRQLKLRRVLRDVTTLISFEEVFGSGLLERFEASQPPAVTR